MAHGGPGNGAACRVRAPRGPARAARGWGEGAPLGRVRGEMARVRRANNERRGNQRIGENPANRDMERREGLRLRR